MSRWRGHSVCSAAQRSLSKRAMAASICKHRARERECACAWVGCVALCVCVRLVLIELVEELAGHGAVAHLPCGSLKLAVLQHAGAIRVKLFEDLLQAELGAPDGVLVRRSTNSLAQADLEKFIKGDCSAAICIEMIEPLL